MEYNKVMKQMRIFFMRWTSLVPTDASLPSGVVSILEINSLCDSFIQMNIDLSPLIMIIVIVEFNESSYIGDILTYAHLILGERIYR